MNILAEISRDPKSIEIAGHTFVRRNKNPIGERVRVWVLEMNEVIITLGSINGTPRSNNLYIRLFRPDCDEWSCSLGACGEQRGVLIHLEEMLQNLS
jgi:hypothetical protein